MTDDKKAFTSNLETLLPCPFCGRTDTLRFWPSTEAHEDCDGPHTDGSNSLTVGVVCDASDGRGCGASSGFDPSEETAATRWNRRSAHETSAPPTPEWLAILFHDTYERLAPSFGYQTRPDTRRFDPESSNGRLMIAVCAELLEREPALRSSAQETGPKHDHVWVHDSGAGHWHCQAVFCDATKPYDVGRDSTEKAGGEPG